MPATPPKQPKSDAAGDNAAPSAASGDTVKSAPPPVVAAAAAAVAAAAAAAVDAAYAPTKERFMADEISGLRTPDFNVWAYDADQVSKFSFTPAAVYCNSHASTGLLASSIYVLPSFAHGSRVHICPLQKRIRT